tara:strand:- start:1076 stop:1699 length:624 start_codon:yes stop_codon:yes gene_type:complete
MNTRQIKLENIKTLSSMGVDIPESLPEIESISELSPQADNNCAKRVIVLGYMIGFGFKANPDDLKAALERYDLWSSCSHKEKGLFGRELSPQEVINCTWLTECVQAFAWAFNLADLNHFQRCDDSLANNFPAPFSDPSTFINNIKLRPIDEIHRMADLHYRMHWAARESRITGKSCRLEEGIISERRKTLDWIIGVEKNWDEVPLDT